MQNEETFIELIGDIYEAALDPTLWSSAIKKAVGFVGGAAGWIIMRNSVSGASRVFGSFGDTPHYREVYLETYVEIEPISHAITLLQPGEAISNSRVTTQSEFIRTRFYKEWMEPQGWLDNASVVLDRWPTKITAFTVVRSRENGWVDDDVLSRMQSIAPHLRHALLSGDVIREKAAAAATLIEALNGIEAAVFFIDTKGNIIHANTSGGAMLAEDVLSGAEIAQQTLPEHVAGPALLDAFIRARENGATANFQDFCAPLRARDGGQYVLHAMPLAPDRQWETAEHHRAVAVLFVQESAIGGKETAEAIARQYKLTRMELRVLLTLTEAGGVPETARKLGIGITTVRTHLRRLFSKTGTSRQLDLAKLIAGFSSGLSP